MAALCLLVGCSLGPPAQQGHTANRPVNPYDIKHDYGPATSMEMDGHEDIVPRVEPRSRGGNPGSYVVLGKKYWVMKDSKGYKERGIASWYGKKFHGRKTSNGETYDMYAMSAAHKTLPIPTYLRVTNLKNGRSTIVRVNDRGPFHENRIIDLSYAAASKLGVVETGTGLVEIEALDPAHYAPQKRNPVQVAQKHHNVGLYIQIGAFASRQNAERLQNRLQANDFKQVSILPSQDVKGMLYRVRLGPIATVDEADTLSAQLAIQGMGAPKIVID